VIQTTIDSRFGEGAGGEKADGRMAMGRWEDGKMGGWEDGRMGRKKAEG
jgi:hypothetical protein